MADLFISYAREDIAFVRTLDERLRASGRKPWVDWEGIPPSAEWLAEIRMAIDGAGVFVTIISPDFLVSTVCLQELEHALARGKRIVPVLHREASASAMHPALARLNWVFIRASDDLDAGVRTLEQAVDTDLDWVRAHTRLLVRAAEWDGRIREASYTLRGRDLRAAESWLGQAPTKDPHATTLHTEYILASRRVANRRQRIVMASVALGVLVAAVLSVVASFEKRERGRQQEIAGARQLVNLSEALRQTPVGAPDMAEARLASLRPAVQALARFSKLGVASLEADQAVRRALTQPLPMEERPLGRADLQAVAFDPSGRFVASVTKSEEFDVWDLEQRRSAGAWKYAPGVMASTHHVGLNRAASHLASLTYDASVATNRTTLTLWRLPGGERVAELVLPGRIEGRVRVHPAATSVYVVQGLQTFTWDVSAGTTGPAPVPGAIVWDLAFSPDGRRLAVLFRSREARLRILDTASGAPVLEQALPARGRSVAWSPDGSRLTVAVAGALLQLDPATGAAIAEHKTPDDPPFVSPDGERFADLPQISIVRTGRFSGGDELVLPVDSEVATLAFQQSGLTLATVTKGAKIALWSLRPDDAVGEVEAGGEVSNVDVDGASRLVSIRGARASACWELPAGTSPFRQPPLVSKSCPDPLPAAHTLDVDATSGSSRIVDHQGKTVWTHRFDVPVVAGTVTPAGTRAAFMLQTQQTRAGKLVVVEVWDTAGQRKVRTIEDRDLIVRFNEGAVIGLSRDGRHAALPRTGGVSVWELTQPSRIADIYQRGVTGIAFDDGGSRVALATRSGAIHVFTVATAEEIARVQLGRAPERLALSPDGRWLVAAGADRMVRVWGVAPDVLIAQACSRLAVPCP